MKVSKPTKKIESSLSSPDPARDGWNWWGYCAGNPVMFIDPDGLIAETAWDIASLSLGIVSLGYNIYHGNTKEAIFDGIGILADAAAVALPFIPGGVGAARKAVKSTKIAAEAVGGIEAVISGGKSIAEGIQNGDYLEASLGALQAVAGAGQLGNAANQATDFTKYGSKIFNKDAKVPENSSIFWTGCGDAGITARNYATENGGITLEMFIEQEGIRAPKWNPKPSSAGWWDDASKEFADLASGQTEVLVGPRVTQTSVFNRIELPTLMKNENVSSISIKPTKVE